MKQISIFVSLFMLTGCLTIVPAGYYQPHMYNGQKQDSSNLAIVYGNCGKSENSTEEFVGIWGVDDLELNKMYAIKVYVKPGKRKLQIGVNDGNFSQALDLEHEFLAGHQYQIVTQWGATGGGFLKGYNREFKVGITDMGENYKPAKGIYTEHDHNDPLVVKDYSIDVSSHDCVTNKTIAPIDKSQVKPEYKKIFRDLGYDL
jgi:hypothetical protein